MDFLRQHEIAEAGHRILNPITDEKLELLGELCRWQRDQRRPTWAAAKARCCAPGPGDTGYRAWAWTSARST